MSSYLPMRALPLSERPYEKLEEKGADALSQAELLAILIGSGRQGKSALDIGRSLLVAHENLHRMAEASLEELQGTRGIGRVGALRIHAAVEIGRRLGRQDPIAKGSRLTSSKAAIALMQDLAFLDREEFHVILLDGAHRLIRRMQVSQGNFNQAMVYPRDIFRRALRANAAAMILVHNHPSGDASPSESDVTATERFIELGQILGVKVLDHLIIGRDGSLSLKDLGLC